jgi:hypothetical protein
LLLPSSAYHRGNRVPAPVGREESGMEGGRSRSNTGWGGRESELSTAVFHSVVFDYVAMLNKLI